RFEKQICQRDYWSFYTNASDDKIDYVEIQFKVLGVSDEVTPPPAEDDNKEEVPPAEDNKQENDKTPDTGAENYGFITVIVALLGVMVIAVKKNKKSAK
ncbi:MAG: LPXTG cell wall anchor domain-containing protein, partial [Oscillospiraceae bacterium]|nr:LPXTG cell wall anchor domain-containing protein [Oscillospiraceae bacterium]